MLVETILTLNLLEELEKGQWDVAHNYYTYGW